MSRSKMLLGTAVMLSSALAGLTWWTSGKASEPSPPIRIEDGFIQGIREGDIDAYKGIPFAAPPIGALRWRAPQSPKRWKGVLKASTFKPACMQVGPPVPGMETESVSEDCLYLNIWTADKQASAPRPVMVWLHGGEGRNGSPSARPYWGDQLARKGVVVVNVAYRLGIFGALAHPELTREAGYKASGNYALLDIIQALRWIQKNIDQFGGDAHNITLFGHSAGAWYASKLVSSPMTAGLFRRVIALAGGDFTSAGEQGISDLSEAEAEGVKFAALFGSNNLAKLRSLPAERINSVLASQWPSTRWSRIATIVDGYVLHADNYSVHSAGKQQSVDLLLGYTADEGNGLVGKPLSSGDYLAYMQRQYGPFATGLLASFPGDTDTAAVVSQKRFKSIEAIAWHVTTWARLHADSGHGRVFFYYFTHVPPFGAEGAAHGSELTYVFDFPPRTYRYTVQAPLAAKADSALVDIVQTYLTNFAAKGDPNGRGLPTWPELHRTNPQALQLDSEPQSIPLPDQPAMSVFDRYMACVRRGAREFDACAQQKPFTAPLPTPPHSPD